MQSPRTPLPLGRILLVGAVVPTVFTAVDHWLSAEVRSGSVWVPLVFVVYIAQVGILGVLSARLIPLSSLRWIIYGWGWLLFDSQAILAAMNSQRTPQAELAEALVFSFFAAQIGLLTVWAVLGSRPHWAVRWPVAVILSVVLALPALEESDGRYATQTIALLAICGALAWQRFRLFRATDESGQPIPTASGDYTMRVQFGVRHVLIWTTTIAILLAILRALDLLTLEYVRRLINPNLVWIATEGGVVAIVLVVSLWAGLGEGPAWLRWPLPFVIGVTGGLVVSFAHWSSWSPVGRIPATRFPASAWQHFRDLESARFAWICLAGGLLFAGLLYFRTQGVRLSRMVSSKSGVKP